MKKGWRSVSRRRPARLHGVVQVAPNDARGRALGIFYFLSSVMALSASIATDELWKHFGARVPFYLSAGLAALAAVLIARGAPQREGIDISQLGEKHESRRSRLTFSG